MQAQKVPLQKRLEDSGFYAKDPKGFAKLTQQLGELEAKIARAEEEWLELEMLREEIEG